MTEDLALDLAMALTGWSQEQARQWLNAQRAEAERKNARANSRNRVACRRAIGKEMTIRTATGRIRGVVESASVAADGRAFDVTILQSDTYRFNYRVKSLPR